MAKRLVDLYVTGTEVRFEDDEGGPDIVVWLKKLQPFEMEQAMARANQHRARVLAIRHLPADHPEVLALRMELEDNFTREDMIAFVSAKERNEAAKSAESKISFEDAWAKDDYLKGLQESWVDELETHYFSDEHPDKHNDAVRVFEELKRFKDQVDVEYDKLDKRILREYGEKSQAEIEDLAFERLLEMRGDMKWLEEFRYSEIWLATRCGPKPPERNEKYFQSRDEINELQPTIYNRLRDAYDDISVHPEEGKG